jgi:hypothetical protein
MASSIGAREAAAARCEQAAGKRAARQAAVPVGPGTAVGLGSQTTTDFALHDLAALAASLLSPARVAEAGPFCGLASDLIIAGLGGIRHREKCGHG